MAEPFLIDSFGRRIDYLRMSITDRCNFRCVYCMPEEGAAVCEASRLLTWEELRRVAGVAARLGVSKLRLTGGEPLVRRGLAEFVASLAPFGFSDLSLTTNGFGLAELAPALAAAGLSRVNVSLDTLRPERFLGIARRGDHARVQAGIAAALASDFAPVKLNVVAMRGVNDDEAAEFAALTLDRPLHVRFIELMPVRWNLDEGPAMPVANAFPAGLLAGSGSGGSGSGSGSGLDAARMRKLRVDAAELRARIESAHGQLEPASVLTNGPARTFRIPGAAGTVGFISQLSHDLCRNCNRLRLTADGMLRPCLLADGEWNLAGPLRAGAGDAELAALFRAVVAAKPERHYLAEGQRAQARGMSAIGG